MASPSEGVGRVCRYRWTCGSLLLPELPTRPITSPAETRSPRSWQSTWAADGR